jgi:hypothetical protein
VKAVASIPGVGKRASLGFFKLVALVIAACVLTMAQSSPPVHLDAARLGPRPIEEVTGTAIARSYAQAWRDFATALQSDRTERLGEEFVGVALDRLTQRIAEQKQTGVRVRIIDHGHNLKAVFYSTDGTAMQLLDQAQLEIQTFDGDKLLDTQNAPHEYVVIMTPGADRWYVRNLEEISAESFDARR